MNKIETREKNQSAQRRYLDKLKKDPERYQAYKEMRRDGKRRYRRRRKLRPLVKLADRYHFRPFQLFCIAKKQKLICPITGRRLTKDNISIDHIIPKSSGGKNVIENIRLVDKNANLAKHTMNDTELLVLAEDIVRTLSHQSP